MDVQIAGVFSVDTAKTVLVPVDLYEDGMGEDYLRFGGMALSGDEKVVVSEPRDGMVAVMGVAPDVLPNVLSDALPATEMRFTSPLLEIAKGKRRNVNIFLTRENVYIVVWEKSLRMAEVFPDNSVAALLYYMQVMGRRFKLKKFDIDISGHGAETIAEALSPYFGRVRVS